MKSQWVNEWVDELENGQIWRRQGVDAWTAEWMSELWQEWVDAWTAEWMGGLRQEWVDAWTTDGWVD